jgi:hypothetical protein
MGRLVPVESVLEHVLAPIAAAHPTLLLVMDGLSTSIFRELFARIASQGWAEMVPSDLGQPLVGVAALPTVTEVSRASLLCGRLTSAPQRRRKPASLRTLPCWRTAARTRRRGCSTRATWPMRPTWRPRCARRSRPSSACGRRGLQRRGRSPERPGSVASALGAGGPAAAAAAAARGARSARVVVITADHGHLLEDGTTQLPGGESDRWRPGTNAATPQRSGGQRGRVVTSDGSNAVVCLWGESTRYAGRKNGYHGGLSPQEVTVPAERDRAAGD